MMSNEALKVGPKALALIHHFEQCKLNAYRDAVGIPTIGWGMTYYPDGSRVQMGDKITQDQADDMFARIMDLDFAGPVRKALGDTPTTPAQFGAMCALAYNIGLKGFTGSSVLRRHRAGASDADVTAAFQMWNKGGGKILNGLVRRRNAEAALYRSDWAAVERFTNGQVKA
jgi:GH24 family phage-related lysozyme (muramidase)